MFTISIMSLGEKKAGKTQLLNILFNRGVFNTKYKGTISHEMEIIEKNGFKFQIWDISGDPKYQDDVNMYYRTQDIVFFYVDLSKFVEINTILNIIKPFQDENERAKIVLIGTKSDEMERQALANFTTIGDILEIDADKRFVTSAKNNEGIDALSKCLTQLTTNEAIVEELPKKKSCIDDAIRSLSTEKVSLPKSKLLAIKNAFSTFSGSTDRSRNPTEIAQASKQFLTTCEGILNDKHSDVMKVVLHIVAIVVVTALTALIGFGIGCSMGLWIGPSAFITGVMTANLAAAAVVTASAVSGGLTAYGLFKTPNEITPSEGTVALKTSMESLRQHVPSVQ